MPVTKYFAIIDDQRQGPFTLEELYKAGVTPDTYVWCKKMATWDTARNVEEIRNFTRGYLERKRQEVLQSDKDNTLQTNRVGESRRFSAASLFDEQFPMLLEQPDINMPPNSMIIPAIIVTMLCFPITGLVALYYGIRSRKEWADAMRGESPSNKALYSDSERTNCKERAHHFAGQAQMWIGISIFAGFILQTTLLFFR